jgi:hypothetical protein
VRLKKIVSRYRRKDVYNGDESGSIQSVAPDAGLSLKKIKWEEKGTGTDFCSVSRRSFTAWP